MRPERGASSLVFWRAYKLPPSVDGAVFLRDENAAVQRAATQTLDSMGVEPGAADNLQERPFRRRGPDSKEFLMRFVSTY
jgi:hypothetical protein